MEDGGSEKIAAGTVVEPSEDKRDRNEEDDAEQKVSDQSEAKGAVKVERRVPQGPRQPHEETRKKRREALLELRKKKAAPAGFFKGGGEQEIMRKAMPP